MQLMQLLKKSFFSVTPCFTNMMQNEMKLFLRIFQDYFMANHLQVTRKRFAARLNGTYPYPLALSVIHPKIRKLFEATTDNAFIY